MIENLNGLHETPSYRQNTHICLYKNTLFEDYPNHWHSPLEILMPVENGYTAWVGDRKYELKPYEILFIGPCEIHSTQAPSHGVRYFFQADVSRLRDITGVNSILSFIGHGTHITPENAPDIHPKLVALYQEICVEYFQSEESDIPADIRQDIPDGISNSLYEPSIYAKLLTMLTLVGRNHIENVDTDTSNELRRKEYISKFMNVCAYIDTHYAEDLNLEEIAEMASFSKFHFSRLFKQFSGVSFYKYVNQKRIAHAEELLIDPDVSVTQVAIQSGFSSPSAFIRMFKLIKGCTPTGFRKIHEHTSFSNLS